MFLIRFVLWSCLVCVDQLANVVLHDNFAADPVQAIGPGLASVAAQHFLAAVAALPSPGQHTPDSVATLATWLNCDLLKQVARDISEALPAANPLSSHP